MWPCCMLSHILHTLTQRAFISSSVFKSNAEASYDYGFFFFLASGSILIWNSSIYLITLCLDAFLPLRHRVHSATVALLHFSLI